VEKNEIIRLKQLERILADAEYKYRVMDDPIMSDQDYDKLTAELKTLSQLYPEHISPNSPINKIGSVLVGGFQKVKHSQVMGSIENTYSTDDLKEWANKLATELDMPLEMIEFVLEDKYDGISGTMLYDDGKLIKAATRGDGMIGDDITENAKMVRFDPNNVYPGFSGEIRGEYIIPKKAFEKVCELEQEKFKNPRNLVSGTMKSLDSTVVKNRYVHFMPFQVMEADGKESYSFVQNNWKFSGNIHQIIEFIQDQEKTKDYKKLDYLVDGMVVKLYSLNFRKKLGYSGVCPKWAVAYKYIQEKAETQALGVTWQCGRNKITPVLELKPVDLEGSTISRATLHNVTQFKRLNIHNGDVVEIEKAGFIIPYVNRVVIPCADTHPFEIPVKCPSCGAPTRIEKIESEVLVCSSDTCIEKLIQNILYFVSTLEIDSIGDSFVRQIVRWYMIRTPLDLLCLTYENIASLPKMGKKNATKIFNNIKKAHVQPLAKVIQCLGIPEVGESNSEKLAQFYKSFDAFIVADLEDLQKVVNVGEKTALEIVSFVRKNVTLCRMASDIFVIRKEEGFSEKLKGKKFVITGEATKSRDELVAIIKKNGGEIASSVSKKTDYVIIGSKEDASFNSSKKKKAEELSIPIYSEFWLFEQLGISLKKEPISDNPNALINLF
jgi:DNA ligase (NAD+)